MTKTRHRSQVPLGARLEADGYALMICPGCLKGVHVQTTTKERKAKRLTIRLTCCGGEITFILLTDLPPVFAALEPEHCLPYAMRVLEEDGMHIGNGTVLDMMTRAVPACFRKDT